MFLLYNLLLKDHILVPSDRNPFLFVFLFFFTNLIFFFFFFANQKSCVEKEDLSGITSLQDSYCNKIPKPAEQRICSTPCVGECVVSEWSEWTKCSVVSIFFIIIIKFLSFLNNVFIMYFVLLILM